MELGKIYNHYFTKCEITSYIISSFNDKNKDGEYYSDTLSLYHAFSVHHEQFGHYFVSLLIKRYNSSSKPKPALSLSKIQKRYSEQGYSEADDDILLTPIYDYLLATPPAEDKYNVYFETPITISAQATVDFGERRVTSYYNIIGVCLERIKSKY